MNNTTKQIYTKDKAIKITFRCNDALAGWITSRSAVLGVSPSAMVRNLCYQNFYAETTLKAAIQPTQTSTETAVKNGTDN